MLFSYFNNQSFSCRFNCRNQSVLSFTIQN